MAIKVYILKKAIMKSSVDEYLELKAEAKEKKKLEKQMQDYAKNLEFEKAAQTRDQLHLLRERAFGAAVIDRIRMESKKK